MNKIIKKALAVILSAAMIFTALPFAGIDFLDFSAWAAEYITGEVFALGSYPNSRVTDVNLLNELNSYAYSWESAESFSGNGSIGSMSEDGSMKFFDVEHDGKMYRAVTFSNFRPELTYRESTEKNSYQDDNGYKTNTVYWFEYEPLKWRIIDAEQGIAVSESLIDAQAFANRVYKIENQTAELSDDYFADASGTVSANSYADSTISEWLNSDFVNTAFNDAEKEQLAASKLGENDFDKIFLPSYEEIASFTDAERAASGTDYAKAMGLYAVEGNSFWWLRDAGCYSYYACRVSDKGSTDKYGNSVDFTSFGVRPAIRLEGGIGGAYTATFEYNGKSESAWYVSGEAITAPEPPEKEGYEFVSWVNSVTGEAMPETMPSENVTYVPNWKPADGIAYTVETYLMNTDGTGYDKTVAVKYGTTNETVTAEATEKEGFTFDADASVVSDVIKADGSTVLKLYYSRNKYSVTVDGAAGVYYFGSKITLTPPAAPEGKAFSHWENQNGETVVSPFIVPAEAAVISSVFSALSFEVTFVADGKVHSSDNYEYGTAISAPSAPSKEGYSFMGWSTDGINVITDLGTVPVGGVIFKAVFSINYYVINYYVQNVCTGEITNVETGSGEYGSVIKAEPENYSAPFGYTLSEAYTDAAFTSALKNGATVPASGVDLYFKLTPNMYDAVFHADGGQFSDGTEVKTVPTAYESEITPPEDPVMEGYDFDGWDPAVSTMDEEGKTFYATWTPAVYTATYYWDGEVYEEFEMNFGDELDVPADPYMAGYEFLGWTETEGSTEFAELPEFMPANDLVYYAVFEISADNTLTFKTEFFKQNPDTEEWEVTDTVMPGDTVKARLYIGTNYYTNAGNFMVFYDNRFFEDSYRSGTSLLLTTNNEAIGTEEKYISGSFAKLASNNNLLASMVAKGYLTQDFVDTHQAFTCQYTFTPSTSVMFNGNYWFAEYKLKVRTDASGIGEFLVAEGSVQNASQRPSAFTNIPLCKENGTATDSTALYNLDINLEISNSPVTLAESVATNSVSKPAANVETQAASDTIALSSAETELEYTWVHFENKTYTPTVYLKYNNEPFDAHKELAIAYKNNSKVGTATVSLGGLNRFAGTAQLDFIISNRTAPDTQAPSNVTMNSASGGTLSGTATFTASATDDDRPAKAVYSYSTDGGATWIPMGEATDSSFTCTLDTTAIKADSIKVKVIFEDASGNQSKPFIADYAINNAPAFTMEIRQPSRTTIDYGDAIYLHADITGTLPAGAKVMWIASNGSFDMEVSADTLSCKISPKSSGTTTFTAVVVDANENPIAPEDTQEMTSKAGFFQKIIAFFKKLFGLTKTYPQKLF